MKKLNRKTKSIGVFALALVLLVSMILPLTAGASEKQADTYVVAKGDTLASIASQYGVTVADIVEVNGMSASAELYVGQRMLIPGAASVEEDTTNAFGTSSTITISFAKDSDLVGVLNTILAHTSYTMIYKGATTNIPAISLQDVTPLTAIDYVLRMVDMTYIKNNDVLYVGTADVLNSTFVDSKLLTSFKLQYISIDTLVSQMGILGVNPQIVKMNENIREFWVSGYPSDLAKIKQIINTLDNKANLTVGSANISSSLTAIELNYITAAEFSSLLSTLGLHAGITMDAHPMTLYVYASGDAYTDIMNIKKLVDYKDANVAEGEGGAGGSTGDVEISDGKTSLVKVDLQYINKAAAENIVSTFGYNVELLGLDLYEKRVWVRGEVDEVNEAVARIKENDTADNNTDRTFFTYELQNIVASELQSKIAFIDLDDVEFYFGSYPELTKSVMVYCPTNDVQEVKDVIASLDNNMGDMYYPIATITDASELTVLAAKEELVVKLINNPSISVTSFAISGDLDPSDEGVKYVLYVLESPENIDLIIDMWGKIA